MSQSKKISTTQLAKVLKLPSKMVFQLLSDKKWIERQDNSWRLTGKGEFEGGEYKQSDKYGEYIVWPSNITEHRIFKEQDNVLLSATRLAEPFGLSARSMNAVLAELGWIHLHTDGWKTTELGQSLGGVNNENSQTGMHYVLWPQAVTENEQFKQTINQLILDKLKDQPALDGHSYPSLPLQYISNWLYIMGLNRAFQRPLPQIQNGSLKLSADFYLPQQGIYIEYWGEEQSAAHIKQKLEKEKYYKDLALNVIELSERDLPKLEDVLSKALLKFGVQLYK